jgi:hypothetical protein
MNNVLTETLYPISDSYTKGLKEKWYSSNQENPNKQQFIDRADEWFKSTKLNLLSGWEAFPCKDIIIGCTNFIESICLKYSWNIQILPGEYSYYSIMGLQPTNYGELKPNVPLLVSVPGWKYCDIDPHWDELLKECEQKNIDIHVDGCWFQSARGLEFNFDHPNIKSFAMSMSKGLDLTWNRIGLRWSRQRTMDSITLLNHTNMYNENLTACGYFLMNNIEKDYAWKKYGQEHLNLANKFNMIPTNSIHVIRDKDNKLFGIGKILST